MCNGYWAMLLTGSVTPLLPTYLDSEILDNILHFVLSNEKAQFICLAVAIVAGYRLLKAQIKSVAKIVCIVLIIALLGGGAALKSFIGL